MKLSSVILAASSASAISLPSFSQLYHGVQQTPFERGERYLIELSPSDQRWVTEDEKWQLRRKGVRFFDITDHQDAAVSTFKSKSEVTYPKKPAHNETVSELIKSLDQKNMRKHLETFTSFHTRYYKSDYGRQSSEWLFDQVNQTLSDAGPVGIVQYFKHPWGQNSIVATLPGKSEKTIVIGAHQDSINLFLPSILAAPGADDDGSGTVTILEALRVILQVSSIRSKASLFPMSH